MSTLSAAMLLFLVMDPIGNAVVFTCILKDMKPQRRRQVLARELCIALLVLVVFLFTGRYIMLVLHLSEPSLGIAGGIILLLIAIKMVFGGDAFQKEEQGEPFIVPLAVPLIAGPSAIATVMLLMARAPQRCWSWLLALVAAWFVSGIILLCAGWFNRVLGERGLKAAECLMGLLLTTLAVEMFMAGLRKFLEQIPG
jgi:multiple antibiotic resistance protein